MDRTSSTLPALQTPVTSAPKAFAICTANVPTPPDAPMIRTVCPGWTRPWSRRPWSAVHPASGIAAACSKVRLAGFRTKWSSRAQAYSASAPWHQPNTASPGWSAVTSVPIASTSPATSVPEMGSFGLRRPVARRMKYGLPLTM